MLLGQILLTLKYQIFNQHKTLPLWSANNWKLFIMCLAVK